MKLLGDLSYDYHLARVLSGIEVMPGAPKGVSTSRRFGCNWSIANEKTTRLFQVSIVGDSEGGEVLLEVWNLPQGLQGANGCRLGHLRLQPQVIPGVVVAIDEARSLERDLRFGLSATEVPCRVSVVVQPEAWDGEIEVRLGGTAGDPQLLLHNLIKPLGVEEAVEMDLDTAAEVGLMLMQALEEFPEDWEAWVAALNQG